MPTLRQSRVPSFFRFLGLAGELLDKASKSANLDPLLRDEIVDIALKERMGVTPHVAESVDYLVTLRAGRIDSILVELLRREGGGSGCVGETCIRCKCRESRKRWDSGIGGVGGACRGD
jgi:hypothetical protein